MVARTSPPLPERPALHVPRRRRRGPLAMLALAIVLMTGTQALPAFAASKPPSAEKIAQAATKAAEKAAKAEAQRSAKAAQAANEAVEKAEKNAQKAVKAQAEAAKPAKTPKPAPSPRVLGESDGFGQYASGGAGGPTRTVTSLADSGPGSLREALGSPGPAIIRFGVSGDLALSKLIKVPSDITIDGAGAAITITGKGFTLDKVRSVVIRNLVFRDGVGGGTDAIWVNHGSSDVWIDHNEFSNFPDGLLDITNGSSEITVSWNYFSNHNKVMLINDEGDPGVPVRVTLHHNFFENTGQRNPVVRFATVHAYNNVLKNWTIFGMRATKGGQLLSQSNVFIPGTKTAHAIDAEGDLGPGAVRSEGDVVSNGAQINQGSPELVFSPAETYPIRVQLADTGMLFTVAATAGRS